MSEGHHDFTESDSRNHQPRSRWSPSPDSSESTSSPDSMLSINFSTPLAGAARSERIKQMTNNHVSALAAVPFLRQKHLPSQEPLKLTLQQPAFAKARVSQEILVKLQTSLRRMPGVSSKESNEIISQLQEVGQIISQETSQLVDALMNLTLDQEDTDKAIARMSIEANLTKAEADDQAQTISNLRVELSLERDKRKEAEAEVAKVMEDLQTLTRDFKSYKEKDAKSEDGKSPRREEMIKVSGNPCVRAPS